MKISDATNATSQDQHSPSEGGRGANQLPPVNLERIHSFSVNKQQVSIVQVNNTLSSSPSPWSSTTTATLDPAADHPDIQFADSEDIPVVVNDAIDSGSNVSVVVAATATPSNESVAKPGRPPKPERLALQSNNALVEKNNNNKSESEDEQQSIVVAVAVAAPSSTLPRPAPRPQPPIPPIKPRTNLGLGSSSSVSDSTDF